VARLTLGEQRRKRPVRFARATSFGLPVPAFLRLSSASPRWIASAAPRRPFGVVLLRHGIAERRHQPVTELLGDVAALKGSASSLYSPRGNYPSNIVPLGPMLAIFEASRGTSHQQ
jgi:hypothetical protein